MALFFIAIAYLLIGTSSNLATMYLSFAGANLLVSLLSIAVHFLEFYIIFALAKRHANGKFLIAFRIYWAMLIVTAVANVLIHNNLNYAVNIANQVYMIALIALLMIAPAGSKRLKVYGAFKIVTTLYFINLFAKAIMAEPGDLNTITIILLLSFITDCLLLTVAWWSCRLTSTSTKETSA